MELWLPPPKISWNAGLDVLGGWLEVRKAAVLSLARLTVQLVRQSESPGLHN